MIKKISLLLILLLSTSVFSLVTGDNSTNPNVTKNISVSLPVQTNFTQNITATNSSIRDGNPSVSYADQQFLFLMNQYWIPDYYDIKGRIDSSATFGSDLPQMLNLSADYARIRLKKNINETNGYSLSPSIAGLRTLYQNGAMQSISVVDRIMVLNRSDEKFGEKVPTYTAALSLYGTWLEYQTMRCYNLPNMTYPEIAAVPPEKFMQVMGAIKE